jgi:hypothetical protein
MDPAFLEDDDFFGWSFDELEPLSYLGVEPPPHANATRETAPSPPRLLAPPPLAMAEPLPQPEPNELALTHDAPVVATRSGGHGTVAHRLFGILGCEIRQSELKALHQGLFKDILPPMTRDQKRVKFLLMASFEAHNVEVLAMLDSPEVIRKVLHIVLALRPKDREQRDVYAHIWRIS